MMIRCATMLVLTLAHVAVHVGTALKIETRRTADLEHDSEVLHVKLHSILAGLREQLHNNNAPATPMLIEFQNKLQQTLSDTVYMKDKHAAWAELTSAYNSVEQLVAPYNAWEAAHRSYKLATDSGILLEETASSLDTRLSKMERDFQAKKNRHEKRLATLRILARASAGKPNKDALEHEEESFNKLSEKRSKQFAKMRAAVDAAKKKEPNFLFAFMRAVHDAAVSDDLHASALP